MTSALDKVGTDPTERLVGTALHNVNYLTHIDDVRKLAYIETPKVACTSIKKFIADQYVGGTFKVQDIGDIHNRDISPLKQIARLAPEVARAFWVNPDYRPHDLAVRLIRLFTMYEETSRDQIVEDALPADPIARAFQKLTERRESESVR